MAELAMNTDEFLEHLWSNIINRGLDQKWAERLIAQKMPKSAFPEAGPALERMLQAGVKIEDIARVAREARYEACFEVLSELEELEVRNQKKVKSCIASVLENTAQRAFDENWAKQTIQLARKDPDAPFADSGLALKSILDSGDWLKNMGSLLRREAHDAVALVAKAAKDIDLEDLDGVHESFLSADPTGMEGRPGSWPAEDSQKKPRVPKGKEQQDDGPLFTLRNSHPLLFAPDGSLPAAGSPRIYQVPTGQELTKCDLPSNTSCIAFSPDGKQLAGVSTSGRLGICDARTGKSLLKTPGARCEGSRLRYSPEGTALVFGDWNGVVHFWDPLTGSLINSIEYPQIMIYDLDFSADGKTLAIALRERDGAWGKYMIAFWDWPAGKKERSRLSIPDLRDSDQIGFHPKEPNLAVITCRAEKQAVSIFELPSGKIIREIMCPGRPWAMAWSPDGELLAVTTDNGLHLLFDVHQQAELCRVPLQYASSAAFSPDGRLLALGSSAKGSVWEIARLVC